MSCLNSGATRQSGRFVLRHTWLDFEDFTLEPVCALRYFCPMSTDGQCPFCHLPENRNWLTTPLSVASFDGYPVAEGHALVIPRRHVASLFELSAAVQLRLRLQAGRGAEFHRRGLL